MTKVNCQDKDQMRTLGHDIKNTLTSIKAFTQLLQMRAKKQSLPDYEEYLEKINQKIDLLTPQIGELLDCIKQK